MDPSELTIRELIVSLKPAKLWSLLGALVALAIGAFTGGHYAATQTAEARIQASNVERQRLEAALQQALPRRSLQAKDLYLSLALRYMTAMNEGCAQRGTESATLGAARQALNDHIVTSYGQDRLVIHKGGQRQAVIEFDDGTKWEIPSELFVATASADDRSALPPARK